MALAFAFPAFVEQWFVLILPAVFLSAFQGVS